jgi:hypothetical protein
MQFVIAREARQNDYDERLNLIGVGKWRLLS